MYERILAAIDIVHEASRKRTLRTAAALARAYGAELHVVNVVPSFGMSIVADFFPKNFEEKAIQKAEDELERVMEAELPADAEATGHVRHGRVYDEIIKTANEIIADLIVMAAYHPDAKDYLVGSNSDKVATHAEQSVFLVRD